MKLKEHLFVLDNIPFDLGLASYFHAFNIDLIPITDLDAVVLSDSTLGILVRWEVVSKDYLASGRLQTLQKPVIAYSQSSDNEVCIKALSMGADDFLLEPLQARELHARLKAIQRRVSQHEEPCSSVKEALAFDRYKLYPASHEVFDTNENKINLSPGEYELLMYFVQRPQEIITREELTALNKMSDHKHLVDRRIDVQISRLRQKIEDNPQNPQCIKTIRNQGYMLTTAVKCLKSSN